MAIRAKVLTRFNEERDLYIRINNVGDVQNNKDGTAVDVRIRGYLSDFTGTEQYIFDSEEDGLTLKYDVDITQPLWSQIYDKVIVDPSFTNIAKDIRKII